MNVFANGHGKCGGIFDVEGRRESLAQQEQKLASPDFWNDPLSARETIAKANRLRSVVAPFGELTAALEEVTVFVELAEAEDDEKQRRQVADEALAAIRKAERAFVDLELRSLLSGELDDSNAYITVHAGAGGTESCDWAGMLLRMYRHYCEDREFAFNLVEHQSGDEAGIKRATFQVVGAYAYGYLKAERGVHRLVRISPFDANKRRHTSFAAVDVVAELDDAVEVEILDEDIRIDTYRSSGAGGQHVNTTDSAVRITHFPTGIVVGCQAERSQHKNRAKAMKLLRARVYEWTLDQQRKTREKFYGEKGEIAWGSQIRSYVLQPYTMVKDHRTACETSGVDAVLDGDIQLFIEAYLKQAAGDAAGAATGPEAGSP